MAGADSNSEEWELLNKMYAKIRPPAMAGAD